MPRRGGGWLRETVFSHAGIPTPPRFARLPLPEEGARMILGHRPLYNCGDAATALPSQRRVTSLGAFSVVSIDFVLTFEFFVCIETDDAVEVSEFDHILQVIFGRSFFFQISEEIIQGLGDRIDCTASPEND